jgi:hypothetical protein
LTAQHLPVPSPERGEGPALKFFEISLASRGEHIILKAEPQGGTETAGSKEVPMSKKVSDVYYAVIESCMRPGGAWAKSIARFHVEQEAVRFALDHGFVGPEYGIVWAQTIAVTRVTRWDRQGIEVERETVFERDVSSNMVKQ